MKTVMIKLIIIIGITLIPIMSLAQGIMPKINPKDVKKAGVVVLYANDFYHTEGHVIFLRLNDKSRSKRSKKNFLVHVLEVGQENKMYTLNYEPHLLYVKGKEIMAVTNVEGLSISITNDSKEGLICSLWDSRTGNNIEKYKISYGAFGKTYAEFLVGYKVFGYEFDNDALFQYIVEMFENFK